MMGTCYSKNTPGPLLESKLPKQKLRDSKRNKKLTPTIELSLEKSPLEENGKIDHVDDSADRVGLRSSTPENISEHFNEKHVHPGGVAPSDSGIESIDNIEDEAAEIVHSVTENDSHSNNLEQKKLESCRKCGSSNVGCVLPHINGNLSSALRQGELLTMTSPCKIHGSQPIRSFSARYSSKYNPKVLKFSENGTGNTGTKTNDQTVMMECKSSLGHLNNVNKSRTLDRSDNLVSDLFSDENNMTKAPLAAFDSIEANLNDSPPHSSQKRQSLLSEILDITQSFCKCDFYSIEYCTRDHIINDIVPETSNDALNLGNNASKQFDTSTEQFSLSPSHYNGESQSGSFGNFPKKFSTPTKREPSLPKNVSFVTEENVDKIFTEATDNRPIPTSIAADNGCLVTELLRPSSEEFTRDRASEVILLNKRKDFHMRSASLGSVRAVISDSISEAPDGGIEDDMTSVDMDSVSRVTSLSYSSIRQLVESTEDLVSRQYSAPHVTVDGVECIVIPADSYRQMQMDLATLKQQLISLSSLIQEVEVPGQN